MNIPYVMKKCTCCGRWLVASTVNFYRNKSKKDGLQTECKKCVSNRNKQYREANRDKIAEYKKQYRQDNKEKEAERHKRYYEANKEKVAEYNKQYYEDNKEKIDEQHKQWYEDNKEKVAEYKKQYRKDNKEKIADHRKQYYENNKDKIAEQQKQYYEANKEKVVEIQKQYMQTPQGQAARFNAHNKRRRKKEAQGTGATPEQWLEMMQYFDWRCAYTGERLTDKTRSGDHIVPLDAGGDHMIWNMVPMLRNLNSSKRAKDMLEWYRKQDFYSPNRLAKIYKWQEYAYNKWGKDTEYFNTNDIQITLL